MKRPLVSLTHLGPICVLFVLLCSACEPESVPAKTQITLRVQTTDEALLAELSELRLSVWREDAPSWTQRSVGTIPVSKIRWPLDVPVTPSSAAAIDTPFEVIVEAWAGDRRLAQTRAVSRYVKDSARVLEVWLLRCPVAEADYVCAEPDCHGISCPVCTADGSCKPVGLQTADEEYNISQEPVVKGAPPSISAGPDAGNGEPLGGGSEGGSSIDAGVEAGVEPSLDAGISMDAGPVLPMTCNPTCSSTSQCMVDAAGATCVCLPGYQSQAGSCDDVDECKLGTQRCSENATCLNTPGAFSCECKENFNDVKGDGTQCVDKCQGACDAHAACSVLDGKVSCQCTGSYTGDGKTCMLNPSCEMLNCGANSTCTLRAGTTNMYQCGCLAGYQLASGKCEDINECALTPATCGAGAACANTAGSRTCTCLAGYQKNATTGACENIDDCKSKPCMNGGVCSDSVSDYACECKGTGFGGRQCQTNASDCPAGACSGGSCVDGINDYTCTCGTGYRLASSGKACDIINCGPPSNPLNGSVATPSGTTYNQPANYACATGYKLNGTATRTCTATGWGTAPTCTQILCPALTTNPSNGSVSAPNRAVGQIASYTCSNGYGISSGNMTRTCVDDGAGNGVWTGNPATCALACTINDSCRPGDVCLSTPDCGNGAVCSSAGICLTSSCGGGTLITSDDIQSRRYCAEINGDLTVQLATTGPAVIDFPNTSSVLGNLSINAREVVASNRTVTFSGLTRISGVLTIGPSSGGDTVGRGVLNVAFPRLTQTGGGVSVISSVNLSTLDLDRLETINGGFYLYYLDSFQQLRISSLRSATEITTINLPNHPYSPVFTRLESIGRQAPGGFNSVGCCFPSNQSNNCSVSTAPSFCL